MARRLAMQRDVEHGDAAGAQGALDLGGEAVRVDRVCNTPGINHL